jgi:hypothetical protein
MIAWSGMRSASQNVPLSKRPRTGGNALAAVIEAGLAVDAELTGSFLGGGIKPDDSLMVGRPS